MDRVAALAWRIDITQSTRSERKSGSKKVYNKNKKR